MTRGRGDWILGLVDVDPDGGVVVLTTVDILAGVQTS